MGLAQTQKKSPRESRQKEENQGWNHAGIREEPAIEQRMKKENVWNMLRIPGMF